MAMFATSAGSEEKISTLLSVAKIANKYEFTGLNLWAMEHVLSQLDAPLCATDATVSKLLCVASAFTEHVRIRAQQSVVQVVRDMLRGE